MGCGRVSRVRQQVLPLLPADAVAIGSLAGLVENGEGGMVFVCGQATFAFAAGDEVGRRLAAVQLVEAKIASVAAVTAGFGLAQTTLWRWRSAFATDGVAGLIAGKRGPKGPSKLDDQMAARVRELDGQRLTLAAIAAQTGVSTATVRVALGRVGAPTGATGADTVVDTDEDTVDADRVEGIGRPDDVVDLPVLPMLPVLPAPVPRGGERALARAGLLGEAPVVFTEGAHLPLAGLLIILPALVDTGLLEVFEATFGRLRNGFYGLRAVVLTLLFLALLRDPRAEGATRIRPADLGRVLGLDRAPEVKTLRRKLGELAGHGLGAQVQGALAAAHAAARPERLGFLHVDGHTRVYSGRRDLPKTHVARLHMVAHATAETWIADAVADPLLVLTGEPGASLVGELLRLIGDIRAVLGARRRATVIFDRGGWSPACFAALIDAELDILTYRKGAFDPLPDTDFTDQSFTGPDDAERTYSLAETTVNLPLNDASGEVVTLRQIHKRTETGVQIPILTSRTDLSAAEACWRLAGRWRQENYFRYAREHFALDALDSYADRPDDPGRLVPNPAKKHATAAVEGARTAVAAAQADLAAAIDDATTRAGHAGGTATVDPKPGQTLAQAREHLDQVSSRRGGTPSHLPLGDVRPSARLLDEERKLLTHAIRMAAYNAESTLARALAPFYARADDEARALLREAFTLTGDIQTRDGQLHVQLDPATAPRRSRALQALCEQLTATETTYPGTDLRIVYSVKNHPTHS